MHHNKLQQNYGGHVIMARSVIITFIGGDLNSLFLTVMYINLCTCTEELQSSDDVILYPEFHWYNLIYIRFYPVSRNSCTKLRMKILENKGHIPLET